MEPPTFADLEYRNQQRQTRRELFLERLDALIPWARLRSASDLFTPKWVRAGVPARWG